MCSLTDNLVSEDQIYSTGITFNFITFGCFFVLYLIEISREKKLIKYLEVNPQNTRDNDSLELIFNIIPEEYKNKLYRIDYYYKKITYICICMFIVNTILSGRVIYKYSLGNQTTTTFITNVLFMCTKVYDTYYVANTDKSIFYSAYMRDHVQFNDIDPKFKRRLSVIYQKQEEESNLSKIEEESSILKKDKNEKKQMEYTEIEVLDKDEEDKMADNEDKMADNQENSVEIEMVEKDTIEEKETIENIYEIIENIYEKIVDIENQDKEDQGTIDSAVVV